MMRAMVTLYFVHNGRQRYFQESVRAAARQAHVQVLDFEPLADCADFQALRDAYIHLSGKPQQYELDWCIGRYFLLRDHFRTEGVAAGWLLDSDFLLLGPLPRPQDFPPGTVCALSIPPVATKLDEHASSHCAYWTCAALESFCAFVLACYRDNAGALRDLHEKRRAINSRSAISDMILLGRWARETTGIVDLFEDLTSGLIDHNLRMDEQPRGTRLRMVFGTKKLMVGKNGVHAVTVDGRTIPVCGLHFQGGAKMLMPDVAGGHWALFIIKAAARDMYDRLRLLLRKLRDRIRKSR